MRIGQTLAAAMLVLLAWGVGVPAQAQLLGTSVNATVTWSGQDDNGLYTIPIFSGVVTVGSSIEISQAFSRQLTQGGFATASNILDGTAYVDLTDTSIMVRYAGQAQPGEIVFNFTNIVPNVKGQVITGLTTFETGIMTGVNMPLTPTFDGGSVTGMGFFPFGYQPGTDMTQTAALTFGAAPVPEPESMLMMGIGLVALVSRRRWMGAAGGRSD